MPHFHQGTYHPLRLTVGLRSGNSGKLLTDIVLYAGNGKRMRRIAAIFHTVVEVGALDSVRAAVDDIAQKKLSRTRGCAVEQYGGVRFAGIVVDSSKQAVPLVCGFLVLQ